VSSYNNEGNFWLANYTQAYVKLMYKYQKSVIGKTENYLFI